MTNLKVEEVMSEARVAVLLKRAARLRAQAKTLCNERSSRSHSVFILKMRELTRRQARFAVELSTW